MPRSIGIRLFSRAVYAEPLAYYHLIIYAICFRKRLFELLRIAGQIQGLFELAELGSDGFFGEMLDAGAHPPTFANPSDLLTYLGMEAWEDQEPEDQDAWESWSSQEMLAAGFDVPTLVEASESPFDAVLMDALFANERLAIGVLNTNFRRLAQ